MRTSNRKKKSGFFRRIIRFFIFVAFLFILINLINNIRNKNNSIEDMTSILYKPVSLFYEVKEKYFPSDENNKAIKESTNNKEIEFKEVNIDEIELDNNLLLVNREYPFKANIEKSDLYSGEEYNSNKLSYHRKLKDDYIAWGNYLRRRFNIKINLGSGYRDEFEQEEIYSSNEDKSYVQIPGSSEHHTGYALDISTSDSNKDQKIRHLENTAADFGFILRYPKGKEDITGIKYEYWHFRYVGKPHSSYISSKNLSLEEYLKRVKKDEIRFNYDGKNYLVYAEKKSERIKIPKDYSYSVSNSNTGYYIITVELS